MTFLAVLILTVALVVDAEELHCDPDTQFEQNGQCCKMCPPGHKRLSQSLCDEPTCLPCMKDEYQDKHTKDDKCILQPYCDPNKNFKVAVQMETTVKHVCLCKDGFHCSSQECITCVAHTPCKVGFGVRIKGSHKSDTVCEPCSDGTFSNESSAEDACRTWTECGLGFPVEQAGTAFSDNICAKNRVHVIAIIVVVLVLALAAAGAGFLWFIRRGKSGSMKKCTKVNNCIESLGPEPSTPIRQEETRTPEESEDIGITENGNCVVQEHGNAVKLSHQESQIDTTNEHSTLFSFSSSSERLESF